MHHLELQQGRALRVVKRLNASALGENDPCCPDKPLVMTGTQVRAALGLLRKTIPDLAVTTISGDPENPVQYVIRGPTPVESTTEWLRLHAPPELAEQPELVIDAEAHRAMARAAQAGSPAPSRRGRLSRRGRGAARCTT